MGILKVVVKFVIIFFAVFYFALNNSSFAQETEDVIYTVVESIYQDVKLKTAEHNIETGIYILEGDAGKIGATINPDTFSNYAKQFTPFEDETATTLFIDIYTNKGDKTAPYIRYMNIKSKNSDYIRENMYICTNDKEAVNYTLTKDNGWEKEIIKGNCYTK